MTDQRTRDAGQDGAQRTPQRLTVEICFGGLCLFALDDARNEVHVLLLKHDHVEHFPRLIFDKKHTPGAGHPERLACPSLNDRTLTFDLVDGADPGAPVDSVRARAGLANLYDVAGLPPLSRAKYLDPVNPGSQVLARVVLRLGAATGTSPGKKWDWPKGPVTKQGEITNGVQWEIAYPLADALETQCRLVDFDGKRHKLSLTPDADGRVVLRIVNAIRKDLPPAEDRGEVRKGEPAEHFDGYFGVFPGSACQRTPRDCLPVLSEDPSGPPILDHRRSDCKPSTSGQPGGDFPCVAFPLGGATRCLVAATNTA